MQLIKEKLNNGLRALVENLGFLINPILLNSKDENNQLLVFYFHGLYHCDEQRDLNHIDPQKNMTISQFDEFVDYFLNLNYSFIQPQDLLDNLQVDKRYAMITFDDGYFNNMLALDVLEKYSIPAVFFVTADNIIENKAFWWDIIYKNRIKQGINTLKITNEQNHLKLHKFKDIDKYIIKNFGTDAFKPWSDIDRPFNEAEVKTLAKSQYAIIGNHTFHHALLPNYNGIEIEEEIMEANRFLYGLTGITPITIAFPNGYFSDLVLDITSKAGFRVAFNALPGKNKLPISNSKLILLNRFMTNNKNIKNYGSFFRLGYTPGSLYAKITGSINPSKKSQSFY